MFLSTVSAVDKKYTESDGPPAVGWQEATKFFTKENTNSNSTQASTAEGGQHLIFLDNSMFVNNSGRDNTSSPGTWGLTLGLEWDREWLAQGLYIDYMNYNLDTKFSVLTGLSYPRLETESPLYIRGAVGVGYFTGDYSSRTLSFDYNLNTGVRLFTTSGMLFNIELGTKNYSRFFQKSYLNSFVLSSGLAFVF